MGQADLESRTAELKKELMKINSQIAIGTIPKSPGKVKEIRRTIAKILTINNEKAINNKKTIYQKSQIKKPNKGGSKKE